MNLTTWLFAMLSPMLARILLALGFSVVSLVGMDIVIGTLKAQFIAQLGQVPAAGLNLALLAGCGQGIGIILGAIATRLMLFQIQNAARILGSNTP